MVNRLLIWEKVSRFGKYPDAAYQPERNAEKCFIAKP
jgi:hypothetical protein